VVADPESGSNPTDDRMVDVLEDQADDPVYEQLMAFIGALDEDEQVVLIALTWLGRGDASIDEWEELCSEAARAQRAHRCLSARATLVARASGGRPFPIWPLV